MASSVTKSFPLTVKNISLATSPFLHKTSPWRYVRERATMMDVPDG
jgi:hypothetical protein